MVTYIRLVPVLGDYVSSAFQAFVGSYKYVSYNSLVTLSNTFLYILDCYECA